MTSPTQQLKLDETATQRRHLSHIRELDGVRGIAALVVFFHHLCYTSIDPTGWGRSVRALGAISHYGESGVDVFFVLSGFLITSLLIEAQQSRSYYQDFYWKRALRILPLYSLCLVCVLFFIPGTKNYVILSALFLSNFAWLLHNTTPGPFWTLAIEEQFYLIWPTFVRRLSVEQIWRWALSIGIASIGLRFVAAIFGHFNYRLTFFRFDGLACGAFLACWYVKRDLARPNSATERNIIGFSFLAGIVLITISELAFNPTLHGWAFSAAFHQAGVTFLGGSAIAYLISHTGEKKVAWLRSRPLTFFGLISYAMYMLHMYVMNFYDAHVSVLKPGDNAAYALRILVVLAVSIALCLLSRYLIELPAVSLRKYVLAKPRS
jgi:peptidoglycan/LPS O-acetylase OafA/YrhL